MIQVSSLGAEGRRRRTMPASWTDRSSLRLLHGRQAATTFSHTWRPPRLRGMTWSMFSAVAPQYWQRLSSRAKTARRLRAARVRYGTFTKWVRRMTDGAGVTVRSECRARSLACSTSAFCFRTRTTARRTGTTHRGSYVALRTSAFDISAYSVPYGPVAGPCWWQVHERRGYIRRAGSPGRKPPAPFQV